MAKLNQVLAVEQDTKRHAQEAIQHAVVVFSKPSLLNGLVKTYQAKDEEGGERLPTETEVVQYRVWDEISAVKNGLTRLFDMTATKDWSNTEAREDVMVDGVMLVAQAPTTYLLFLEKQLAELEAFARKLPVYDSSKEWIWDEGAGLHKTAPVETVRSKKVPRVLVKYDATDKHPAQTEVWQEDIPVGTYSKVEFTTALSRTQVQQILERIRKLQRAVKTAREAANGLEVSDQTKPGKAVLDFVFGD